MSRLADICNEFCLWETTKTQVRHLFTRQAIAMTWDFGETNVFGKSAGDYGVSLHNMSKVLDRSIPASNSAWAQQSDARTQSTTPRRVVFSTDPPYYDNIGYADLSDFFYIWLRRSLKDVLPHLFSTIAVPKSEELVANLDRHSGREGAETFFVTGMTEAMRRLADEHHPANPVTIYYAFKQSETKEGLETVSTGWETFLEAVLEAGFGLSGTWPLRTELGHRMIGMGTNALASSIILACRRRAADAPTATWREFRDALERELPQALTDLQKAGIAPVDMAQAAIGPGMAVFTRYAGVLYSTGKRMTVREALAVINEVLDETLAEQEGDFDSDTRWALAWFTQHHFDEADFGLANTLSTAKNTSVEGLVEAGILRAGRGRVRLLRPEELPEDWDPATDRRLTVWEMVHHLVRVLDAEGERAAGNLLHKIGGQAETARALAHLLYAVCDRQKRPADARPYNALVRSWPEIARLAREEQGGRRTLL